MRDFPPETLALIAVLASFVAMFAAFVFPSQLEASGHGRMPRKFVSLALFASGNALFFLFLIAGVHVLGNPCVVVRLIGPSGLDTGSLLSALCGAASADGDAGAAGAQLGPAENHAVVTAFTLFLALFGLRWWRRIEHGALRQLHSVHLIEKDIGTLEEHLEGCSFAPVSSAEGRTAAFHGLERRIHGGLSRDDPRSLAVKHEKVEAFLGLWEHDAVWSAVLPRIDVPNIEEVRCAHDRKTTLANRIEDLVQEIETGTADPNLLADFSARLQSDEEAANVPLNPGHDPGHGQQPQGDDGGTARGRSLKELLKPIIDYFESEYDDLLRRLTRATAESVVLSGDKAGDRLATLKQRGFTGLSEIEPIDIHKAVRIGLLVWLAIVLVFWLLLQLFGARFEGLEAPEGGLILVLAFSLMLATVLGSMVAGLRSLARAHETPWGWYAVAGLSMAVVHWILMIVAADLDLIAPRPGAGDGAQAPSPALFLIGAIVPFALVLGMCLLSRRTPVLGLFGGRIGDGLLLGLVLAFAGVMMLVLGEVTGVPSPQPNLALAERMIILPTMMGMMGFIIGVLVVRHVRKAALSNFIETPRPAPAAEPAPQVAVAGAAPAAEA